jgi:mRNA interferase RelE/StbE
MSKRYRVDFTEKARKQFLELSKPIQIRIQKYLNLYIDDKSDPRIVGKALSGHYRGSWRYRVGAYRIICNIDDDAATVLAIKIGKRDKIYSN